MTPGSATGNRFTAILAGVVLAGSLAWAVIATAAPGDVRQTATVDGRGLGMASSVAVSPDGESVYVTGKSTSALAVFGRDAETLALTQKPGAAGCLSEDGSGGSCADGKALMKPESVTVSPDGRSVYVASANGVAVFYRDQASGALEQPSNSAGCWSEDGSAGACGDGHAISGAQSVAVSPDGQSLYLASYDHSAVAVFFRETSISSGALAQVSGTDGCISYSGSNGACIDGRALGGSYSVAVSPDGRSVYVASIESGAGGVAVFDRDRLDGDLTQKPGAAGCITDDGGDLSGAVCSDGEALDSPISLAVSPDGRNVYVAVLNSRSVGVFARDPATGALTQTGSIALYAPPNAVAVSPDGESVYVTSYKDGLAVFRRDSATGALTTPKGGNHPLDGAESVTVSPDGRSVLVPDFRHGKLVVFAREGDSTGASCRGRSATILGTRGPDELEGGPDRDVIVARGGADKVKARAGGDIVCGGPGRDTLMGGAGADALLGGPHVDDLRGGAGTKDRCDNQQHGHSGGPGCER